MSLCRAGESAQARLQRAARSVRLRAPMAAVDTFDADEHPENEPAVEIVLPDTDHCPPEVTGALVDERLDIEKMVPKGPNFVVEATA